MSASFVPDGFQPPTVYHHRAFRLVPLGPEHNDGDYDAWTSSMDHIRHTPGFEGRPWPREMSREENLADCLGHAEDFVALRGFTFTVCDHDGATIGCVYLYPRPEGEGHVDVRSWVRADRAEMDAVVHDGVTRWIAASWPFTIVHYAARPT